MKEIILQSDQLFCRIRYRQNLFKCKLYELEDGAYILGFDTPQKSVTSGQFAVIYFENELIFSGVIS
jgi:tRNA U34 2-thiouridine synthase MnmA/TrmU